MSLPAPQTYEWRMCECDEGAPLELVIIVRGDRPLQLARRAVFAVAEVELAVAGAVQSATSGQVDGLLADEVDSLIASIEAEEG